jgi:hypothetical protein
MKTIFTKTLRDGRTAEISFDGKSLYAAKINGADAGCGHGLAFIASAKLYVVGKVALTEGEKNAVQAAASAIRIAAPMVLNGSAGSVAEVTRSGDINKFSTC